MITGQSARSKVRFSKRSSLFCNDPRVQDLVLLVMSEPSRLESQAHIYQIWVKVVRPLTQTLQLIIFSPGRGANRGTLCFLLTLFHRAIVALNSTFLLKRENDNKKCFVVSGPEEKGEKFCKTKCSFMACKRQTPVANVINNLRSKFTTTQKKKYFIVFSWNICAVGTTDCKMFKRRL